MLRLVVCRSLWFGETCEMGDSRQSAVVTLARRIDLACDRFEQNWQMGRRQSLESYLISVDPTERDAYLRALLELELELRREQGEVPQRDEYLVRFKGDQTLVESLFENAEKQNPSNAARPTIESQIDQTKAGQPKKNDGVRQVVPTEFGRYRIKHQIGAGGMGTVVLAEDTLLGRPVALKIPYLTGADQKEQLERFDREARTAAMLRHPNICPVYDFGEVNGIRYISMAYIEGLPLHKYAAENRLDEQQIARLMWKLAGALQDAHENGVVHRDLKPANIMMDKKGEPIVMDFGLALQMQFEVDVRLTQTGMQMGSPAYMPPEQVDGDKERIGPSADIYSLGVVLYELLTGHVPFEGPTALIFAQIIMKEPIRPSMLRTGLSPSMEAICLKMMAKRIDDRYASMADVATAMREFVKQHVVGNLANNSPAPSADDADKTVLIKTPATKDAPAERPTSVGDIVVVDEEAELRLLSLDISNSLRDHQTDGLLEKVERFLKLQPDNPAMRRLRKRLKSERPARAATSPRRRLVLERLRSIPRLRHSKVVWLVSAGMVILAVMGWLFSDNPDRRAAEWVLSIDGTVILNVNGQVRGIDKAADLPKEQFLLTGINNLGGNKKVSDAGLAHLKHCQNLTGLYLEYTQISDAGLAHLKDCKNLTDLALPGTKVTDAGLAYFKDFKNLTILVLAGTQVSDVGLAHLKDCQNLTALEVSSTMISDAGLSQLKEFKKLTRIGLSGTQMSDAGLAHLKDCKSLTSLRLYGPQFSDAGLVHLKDCKNLVTLELCGATIGDAWLTHFEDCKNLTALNLMMTNTSDAGLACLKDWKNLTALSLLDTKTSDAGLRHLMDCENLTDLSFWGTQQVSEAGAKSLATALPRCKIQWNGGVVEPTKTNANNSQQTSKSETSGTGTTVPQNPVSKTPAEVGNSSVEIPTAKPETGTTDTASLKPVTSKGHAGPIYRVALSPDGKRLASASKDGTVKVWDTVSGQEKLTLKAGPVTFSANGKRLVSESVGLVTVWDANSGLEMFSHKAQFTSDRQRLVSTSKDETVTVWDADSGQETHSFKANQRYGLAFSTDGKRIAAGGSDRTVRVWDAVNSQKTFNLKGHAGTVWHVAFSANGKWLASASEDRTVKMWDAASGEEWLTLKGHTQSVRSVEFSPDGKRLKSASSDGTVKMWDTISGRETLSIEAGSVSFSADGKRLVSHSGGLTVWDAVSGQVLFRQSQLNVASSADGQRLASANSDGTMTILNVVTGQKTITLTGLASALSCASFNSDGMWLASASKDGTVKVWNTVTGQETLMLKGVTASERLMLTLEGNTGAVRSVSFSADGTRLTSLSGARRDLDTGTLKVWDTASGQEAHSLSLTVKGLGWRFGSIALSADGKRGADTGATDGTVKVKVWDTSSGQEWLTLKGHTRMVTGVAFNADGTRLASASIDQTVKIWDADSGRETLSIKINAVNRLALSADGRWLATASSDPTIKVWDAVSGQQLLTLGSGQVSGLAFSADGTQVASASNDGTVKVWNIASGEETLTLKGHIGPVYGLAFSPDGMQLASAGGDQTAKVWDIATGKETLSLNGFADAVMSVAFSSDGKRLASANANGTVMVWDLTLPNRADGIPKLPTENGLGLQPPPQIGASNVAVARGQAYRTPVMDQPVVSKDMAFAHSLSLAEYRRALDQLGAQGFCPTKCKPYGIRASTEEPAPQNFRVAALWSRNQRKWHFAENLTAASLADTDREQRLLGLIPIDISVLEPGRYFALWAEPEVPGQESKFYVDIIAEAHQPIFEAAAIGGWVPHSLHYFEPSDKFRVSVVWQRDSRKPARTWWMYDAVQPAQFLDQFRRGTTDLPLADMQVYQSASNGTTTFAGLWTSGDFEAKSLRVLPIEKHRDEANRLIAEGWNMVSICVAPVGIGEYLTSSVWHRKRKP